MAAVENVEVLQLDGMTNLPPTIIVVLTTRSTSIRPADFWRSREQLQKALKRRWPLVEYAALVEYTTGYAKLSGGRRRPHWNLMLKGIPNDALDLVREVVDRVWCPRVNAESSGQYVSLIENEGGLSRYLAMHFMKDSQKPPAGWKGHRFMHSQGYFAQPLPKIREQARASLNRKRQRWKIEQSLERQCPGVPFDHFEIEEWTDRALEMNDRRSYGLVQLHDELGPVLARPGGRAVRR